MLNFPSSPVLNQEYQRWRWNGTAWVPIQTVAVPMLPIVGGVITGNLGVQGTTSLTGSLTAAGSTNLNTLQVNGAADFLDGVVLDGVDSTDLATKQYVDQAVASAGLWQGTWEADANAPDLTQTSLQQNGWTWAAITPDPTQPYTIPATPVIPGLSGQTIDNGDHVIWSTSASAFQIVAGSSLSLAQAQTMFARRFAATITGDGTTASFVVTHDFANSDVTAMIFDAASGMMVLADVLPTANTVQVSFAVPPAAGQAYRVVVFG